MTLELVETKRRLVTLQELKDWQRRRNRKTDYGAGTERLVTVQEEEDC